MADARFEDGAEKPLRIRAEDREDLKVISALLQDSVLESGDISWMPKRRRLAALVNRFRWEREGAEAERARAMLVIEDVMAVRASGVDPREKGVVLSILALDFAEGADGTGTLDLILAGDGEIRLEVECISVSLTDVTRPYTAPSGRRPRHDLD